MENQEAINSLRFLEGYLYRSVRAMDREVVTDALLAVRAALNGVVIK
jgi:hypothetical protein